MPAQNTAFVFMASVMILVTACNGTSSPPSPTPLPTASPIPTPLQTKNIAYITNGNAKQKLDIFLPADGDKAFPILFSIHGGGGDKNDFIDLAAFLVEKGYALVAINYRDSPQYKYPIPLNDAVCALAWVQTNARTYNLDTGRVFAVGHSLGGTLAAMLAVTDNPNDYMESCPYVLKPHPLQGCITFTGIFDYAAISIDPNISLREYFSDYFNADFEKAPELWLEASPFTWLDESDPPFLLIHGLGDNNVSPDYSTSFADKLHEIGVGVRLLLIPGASHMGILDDNKAYEAIEDFLVNPP